MGLARSPQPQLLTKRARTLISERNGIDQVDGETKPNQGLTTQPDLGFDLVATRGLPTRGAARDEYFSVGLTL